MPRTVEIVVDDHVRIPSRQIPEAAAVTLAKEGVHNNPEFWKKRAAGYSTRGIPAVIKTATWDKAAGEISLPRGAMRRAREILREHGVRFRVVDARAEGAPHRPALRYVGHAPRPYQEAAAREILRVEQGIVRASTGSGKTTTALYAASLIGLNALIVLPSLELMRQTRKVAERLLGLRADQIGIIHGKKKILRPLTLASQKTLWSRTVGEDERAYFGTLIVDEGHRAAARTFQEVVHRFPARYRVAFTADEKRADRKEFLVYDAFGEVIHEFTREEAERAKAIVDVEVRVVFSDYEDHRYAEDDDFGGLLDRMTADERRNAIIVDALAAELRAGAQAIVCTHRRAHARLIEGELVALGFRSGQMLGGEREFGVTREGLLDGSVRAGIGTYEALGEGIDLPAVGAGVAATPIFGNKQRFGQFRGRLCRPAEGKERGRLYVVFDRRIFPEKKFRNILAWNRTVTYLRGGRWVDARGLRGRRAIMSA